MTTQAEQADEIAAPLDMLLTSAARAVKSGGSVRPSTNPKCDRCWHYRADVNAEALCGRCQLNLKGPGEARRFA